jgi:hypothetical protein
VTEMKTLEDQTRMGGRIKMVVRGAGGEGVGRLVDWL